VETPPPAVAAVAAVAAGSGEEGGATADEEADSCAPQAQRTRIQSSRSRAESDARWYLMREAIRGHQRISRGNQVSGA
jgi:hypothetical protein